MKVVVNAPTSDELRSVDSNLQALVDSICETCEAEGMPANDLAITPRLGGKVVSLAFVIRAESAAGLSQLREKLRADSRVRMVF
eukprot:scaffold17986_cov27-Tisochrysis_lutea.AAC.1